MLLDNENIGNYKLCIYEKPSIPTPEENLEHIEIKGHDGSLTKKYGLKNIEYPITFNFFEDVPFKPAFRKVKVKLFNTKIISFIDDPQIFYKVKSITIDVAENEIEEYGKFTVTFTLAPYQYEIENAPIILISPKSVTNDGYKCLPIITATVAGTGNIYIGNQKVTVKDVNGTITIDSEMQNAYRKGSPPQNMNKHMIGKFPVFENGNNAVSFDGDISKLEIVMNRRWV